MKTLSSILIILFSLQFINAQKQTYKCEKIYDAIKLVDEKKYNEGIAMLKECEKIDPKAYTYPYEIALAYTYQEDYKSAISQLEKIKNYDNIEANYFALLGNNYDYLNKPEEAIKIYDEGLKRFPNSGELYLEKGVVLEFDKKYSEAIQSYEKGINVAPNYPSNYYRAANIYLNSDNKLNGLMYGEVFLNIERTTDRTKEMSKKLYETYKNAIIFKGKNEKEISICKSVSIDINTLEKGKKLPFCMIFEKNFVMSLLDETEFNLNSLSSIRRKFLKQYFAKDYKDYPNILLDYQKKMEENNVFDAYNHYIFQMGDPSAFNAWQKTNQSDYDKFVAWYTDDKNVLVLKK